jgi:hypothetical protein
VNGRRVVALTADNATIEAASGSRLTYRRVASDSDQAGRAHR